MAWFANSDVLSVSSTGDLGFFTKENAPEGSAENCLDCKVKGCLYDATRFYLGKHVVNPQGEVSWPFNVASKETNPKARLEALRNSNYSRCVFKSDNDVCDHQDASVKFRNGVRGNFRLRLGGDEPERHLNLYFTGGEVEGSFRDREISITKYTGLPRQGEKSEIKIPKLTGHGGGDLGLIRNFAELIKSRNPEHNKTSAELSLQSHLMAFAAEESRKSGQEVFF